MARISSAPSPVPVPSPVSVPWAPDRRRRRARFAELQFPAAGIDRSGPHQRQAPYTCHDCANVRAFDVLEGRMRGGSREGLVKAFADFQAGAGKRIDLLAQVRTPVASAQRRFVDTFNDLVNWSNAGWDDVDVVQGSGTILGPTSDNTTAAIYTTAGFNWQQNTLIDVAVTVREQPDNRYRLYVGFTNPGQSAPTSPMVELIFDTASNMTVLSIRNVAGTPTRTFALPTVWGRWGLLEFILVPSSGYIAVQYASHELYIANHGNDPSALANLDDMIALEMSKTGTDAVPAEISTINVIYTEAAQPPRSVIVAAADAKLYSEDTSGSLSGPVSGPSLQKRPLSAVERFGELFIADWSEPKSERKTESINATIGLDTSILVDTEATFVTDGVNENSDVIEITSVSADTSPVALGWYRIANVDSETQLTLTRMNYWGSVFGKADSLAYRIVPGLKVYDSSQNILRLFMATAGTAPYGCRVVTLFKDRLVWSGDVNNPGDVFMSRVGDPYDYDYSPVTTTVQDAFAFDAGGLGRLGAPVTALIPVFDDLLIVAGQAEMSVLRGDPLIGGTFDHLSRKVGVSGFSAWTVTDDDQLYFHSIDGIYRSNRGELAGLVEPTNMSVMRIPEVFRNVDTEAQHVMLAYDPERFGILVRISSLDPGLSSAWWYDLRVGRIFNDPTIGFFRDFYDEDYDIFCAVIADPPRRLLVGCRDGYIRSYSRAAENDDGKSFSSWFDIGPIQLGYSGAEGYLDNISIALDENSGNAKIHVRGGKTPQKAKTASNFASLSLSAGLNRIFRPRMRGRYAYLKMQNDGDSRWALEVMEVERRVAGLWRR